MLLRDGGEQPVRVSLEAGGDYGVEAGVGHWISLLDGEGGRSGDFAPDDGRARRVTGQRVVSTCAATEISVALTTRYLGGNLALPGPMHLRELSACRD